MPPTGRHPLLPQWVTTAIAVVVLIGWLVTVVSAVLDTSKAAILLPVTGVLTMVIGAAWGIGFRGPFGPKGDDRTEDT